MFGVLLESSARRQRRAGGSLLSVAVHVAIVGAAAAATAHGTMVKPSRPEVVAVHFAPPPAPRTVPAEQRATVAHVARLFDTPVSVTHIAVPTIVPTSISTPALASGVLSDSVVLGGGASGLPSHGILDGAEDAPPADAWRGNDLIVRIITSVKPRYPESLRQTGIGGRVLVRFTIDTLGRVEMSSVQVLQSTHDLFTRAVRDALAGFRFKPSELRGKLVPSLAEMPFEFSISR